MNRREKYVQEEIVAANNDARSVLFGHESGRHERGLLKPIELAELEDLHARVAKIEERQRERSRRITKLSMDLVTSLNKAKSAAMDTAYARAADPKAAIEAVQAFRRRCEELKESYRKLVASVVK